MRDEAGAEAVTTIRSLLRKYFPAPILPPKPELPRPLFTGVVDFNSY